MGENLLNLHLKTCKLIQYVAPIDKLEHLHKKSTRQYLYSSQWNVWRRNGYTAQRVGLVQSQAISVNNRVGNHNHTPLFTKYVL